MSKHLNHIQNWPERAEAANWSVTALAQNYGVQMRTLQRFFQKNMGKSPKKWLSERRLLGENALIQAGSSVKKTAKKLGYQPQNHLTNAFTKHWGVCPTNQNSNPRKSP